MGMTYVECLAWAFALVFASAGAVNFAGPAHLVATYRRWGYPWWFGRVTGAIEIQSGVSIGISSTRVAGLGLAAIVMVAAVVTLILRRDFSHLTAPGLLLAVAMALMMLSWS